MPERFDSIRNYLADRAVGADAQDRGRIAARTNYVRATYAYGHDVMLPGIEELRDNPALVTAAGVVHAAPVVEPAIVFANMYLPGQELAFHTDVPEFRGVSRRGTPQWLLVAMHHSGLFDRWRVKIATAVTFFGAAPDGDLVVFPDGIDGSQERVPARHDTGVVLDTDSVFHGVARVGGDDDVLWLMRPGRAIEADGGSWLLSGDDGMLATPGASHIRYSVSWKAYCFEDVEQQRAFHDGTDGLDLEQILSVIEADLRDRGVLSGPVPAQPVYAELIIDTYIRFPDVG